MDHSSDDSREELSERERFEAVLNDVRITVADVLGADMNTLTPDSTLLELGAQSFDFTHLVFRLERRFGVKIPRTLAIPARHTIERYAKAIIAAASTRDDSP